MNRIFTVIFAIVMMMAIGFSVNATEAPDFSWDYTIQNGESDWANSVIQAEDGGYLVIGNSSSFSPNEQANLYLHKINAEAEFEWEVALGGDLHYYSGLHGIQAEDGGYVITGQRHEGIGGSSDLALMKISANGQGIWEQVFGNPNITEYGSYVQQTADGGYIVTGTSYAEQFDHVLVLKTDTNGNEIWANVYLGHHGESIRQTSDGGYILVGDVSGQNSDVQILRLDPNGNVIRQDIFGGGSFDHAYSMVLTDEDHCVVTGSSQTGGDPSRVWLFEVDLDGQMVWECLYSELDLNEGCTVRSTEDGGYVISAVRWYGQLDTETSLVKTNDHGGLEWTKTFYFIETGHAGDTVQQTFDGGYIAVGNYEMEDTNHFIKVFKLTAELPDVTVILTPHQVDIQIPAGGGSFNFDIEIANVSDETQYVDVWTEIYLPSGYTYPVLSRSNIELAVGEVITRSNLQQMVPGGVAAGEYMYFAVVKDHNTWEVLDHDKFSFVKLPGNGVASVQPVNWPGFSGWDDIEVTNPIVTESKLSSVYPNPFNPTTTVSISLSQAGNVQLAVYNALGRQVVELANSQLEAGEHQFTLDGTNLSSGTYFIRMDAGETSRTHRVILMK